eukprot:gb/GFBE01067340.1/.p1 GENE.gb/GFBE01067340.1/~~gb/GFBE01067340.1/.p1  ORF type:complete len:214 (+),score=26.12 gb/GFBE01067340.1/:1-642(+)
MISRLLAMGCCLPWGARSFCSYPMWTIPGVGTDSRCDKQSCPKRVNASCDGIYGVIANETCAVYCAAGRMEGNQEFELWRCTANSSSQAYGEGYWETVGSPPRSCTLANETTPCSQTWSSASEWRRACGPDPWKTFCPDSKTPKDKSDWKECCFDAEHDCVPEDSTGPSTSASLTTSTQDRLREKPFLSFAAMHPASMWLGGVGLAVSLASSS